MFKFIKKLIKGFVVFLVAVIIIDLLILKSDSVYKNVDDIDNSTLKKDLIVALNKLEWDISEVKNFRFQGDWNNGKYYDFYYKNNWYYLSMYETGHVYSIQKNLVVSNEDEYLYLNDKIEITENKKNVINLQWHSLGKYGKEDNYDGIKVKRYYIPSGTYNVKTLNKNSIVMVEKIKKYKNYYGKDESYTVQTITLLEIGDTTQLVLKKDECLRLVNNSYVSLELDK